MTVATRLIDKIKISNVRTFTGTGTITMVNEGVLVVKKAIGAATAVTLTPSPEAGDMIFIKDGKGDAASNAITLTPVSGNVDGSATYVISNNYGSVLLHYSGTEWQVVSTAGASSGTFSSATITNATITTATMTTANAATLNATGAINFLDIGAVAATGTVIANAAAITNAVTVVSAANDAKGVILPASVAGKLMLVYSSVATCGLLVYPPVNSSINGGTANASINIEGKTLAWFVCTNATNWASTFTINA